MPSETATTAHPELRRPLRRPRVLPGPLARREADELLDQVGHDPAELAANLADIRRVNRLAGGTRATLRELPALLAAVPADRPATVLDLATGSGDIPRALIDRCRRRGRSVEVIASDVSPEILAEARRHLAGYPEVTFAEHDARAVALPDRGVDIVLCALALHHFRPEEAVLVLREMARLARVGFVLNDITRSRAGYAAAWVASRVATRNRLTHHDMPLSVLRAYTPEEVRRLLATAGLADAAVRPRWLFRMSATWVAGSWGLGARG
jgi:ubiquinone/menaquinone biosynthesis C-methylase UbiE